MQVSATWIRKTVRVLCFFQPKGPAAEAVQVRHPADHRCAELLRQCRGEAVPRTGQEQGDTTQD